MQTYVDVFAMTVSDATLDLYSIFAVSNLQCFVKM